MASELAYYIRLSLADEETGKVKDESESISNQRALILKYISDHPEFDGWKVHEFVDDGYSGTNGDRPDFQRMIDVLESVAKLLFAPKKPNAQKQRFHIVRRLADLRVHQVKSLGFILFIVQNLVGLLEVVIVFSLVFLGVHVAAQDSQQYR